MGRKDRSDTEESEQQSEQESEEESQSEEEVKPVPNSKRKGGGGAKSGGYEASPVPVASASDKKTDSSSATEPAAAAAASEEPAKVVGPLEVEFVPHDKQPPMQQAVKVVYCPNCGLPPDFCQYGPTWEKCKPWCLENFPQYYPHLSGVSLDEAKKKNVKRPLGSR
eukprot:TRINITY_DN14948_c0_g1_i1.p1 TRINITY_DN14948_c0_g1~~TRINITY_DN14948_c0_g1_i1.p1  ORF type:complete len:166 (-),score=30.43 TRINITY_DN14948_c0_g1_i1:379-876(-)